jgi:hypothetical protein
MVRILAENHDLHIFQGSEIESVEDVAPRGENFLSASGFLPQELTQAGHVRSGKLL